ncbi:MAG: hypothetical protein HQL73_11595 [Magnetococcales bacterium]|nr:hypothetical protein [Magnetococcales bacterium]
MTSSEKKFNRLFFQQWSRLERLAQRRFRDTNLADEAILYVQDAMAQDDWAALRAYEGRSQASFATYFNRISWRLLEDFARIRIGRAHVPRWIQDQGPLWEQIFRLLCLERMPTRQLIASLVHSSPGENREVALWAAIKTIAQREKDCGKNKVEEVPTDPLDLVEMVNLNPDLHHLSPEQLRDIRMREEILTAFHRFLTGSENPRQQEMAETQHASLANLQHHLTINDEEQLLLKMFYQDELPVQTVAALLHKTTDQIYGERRRLLEKIRRALEKAGLTNDLMSLLTE